MSKTCVLSLVDMGADQLCLGPHKGRVYAFRG